MAALLSLSVSSLVRSGAPRIRIPSVTGDSVLVRWDATEVFAYFRERSERHAR